MIVLNSLRSILPSPSISYILKIHSSLGLRLVFGETMLIEIRNSLKSNLIKKE